MKDAKFVNVQTFGIFPQFRYLRKCSAHCSQMVYQELVYTAALQLHIKILDTRTKLK